MIQIKDIHYSIGDLDLLKGVEWSVPNKKTSALIGSNGSGKTTLLKIITGEIMPDKGRILKPKKYNIGYLPQEEIEVKGGPLLDSVLQACKEIYSLQNKITEYHHILDSNPHPSDKMLKQLGEYEHRYQALGGYNLENQAKAILSGLGFSDGDWNRPLSEFSGGWRMRVHLARILLKQPDLLLLDEPTNHLDLSSLEWLEQYLINFSGTVVMVSHDRFFMDRLARHIFELNKGLLDHYIGNYSDYEVEKKEKNQLKRKKWEDQEAEIKRQKEFIQKYRYQKKRAAQVQSRIKALKKVQRVEKPSFETKMSFDLKVKEKSYKDVLKIKDLYFKYDQEWVLEDVHLHVCRGDKIALVGDNGAGKTTLTRLINGELRPQQGSIELGKRTKIGYYVQHQAFDLDLKASVFEEVSRSVWTDNIPRIRGALGLFHFRGDDVDKKISVLSGGEKARVSLVKLLLSEANFLIMDEPTNHLDLKSLKALEEALLSYQGTLIAISHDRFFLDRLVNRVVEIKDKKIHEYKGNYSYYLKKRDSKTETDSSESQEPKEITKKRKSKLRKKREAEERQKISKQRNLLETEISHIEERIENLEQRKKEIEDVFCLNETHKDGMYVGSLQKELGQIEKELREWYTLWEDKKRLLEELLT
ncbi:MAG: ATP-binding cassette domain-containing protein [Candidatus Aminicenantes bacterium]|nr:ATP-binding cassette domain-containing protein [Candidatus Aminicenantes bacterium]